MKGLELLTKLLGKLWGKVEDPAQKAEQVDDGLAFVASVVEAFDEVEFEGLPVSEVVAGLLGGEVGEDDFGEGVGGLVEGDGILCPV